MFSSVYTSGRRESTTLLVRLFEENKLMLTQHPSLTKKQLVTSKCMFEEQTTTKAACQSTLRVQPFRGKIAFNL